MKVVLDTNVVVSGIFFGGIPADLLEAWSEGAFELLVSPRIIDEYIRTLERLAESRPGLEYQGVIATLIGNLTLLPDVVGP